MKRQTGDWAGWTIAVLTSIFVLFVLSAPPIMISFVRAHGCCDFPTVYQPFMSILGSDYGRPLLWYFNYVWGAGVEFIGEPGAPSVGMIALYTLVGLMAVTAVTFPFWRRRFRPGSYSNVRCAVDHH